MILVLLANGYEETEAVATIDILKRAKLQVFSVAVEKQSDFLVTGSHGISVRTDLSIDGLVIDESIDAVVLPGGMPGAMNLYRSEKVRELLHYCAEHGKLIAAICAAPFVLGRLGLLCGRRATCFPGFEEELRGAVFTGGPVAVDGNIITADGPGSVFRFAGAIAERFIGKEDTEIIIDSMQC